MAAKAGFNGNLPPLIFTIMNYLAHAYLSFGKPSVLCGNMISDYVKGKQINQYPPAVQQGIRLHRDIDTFTDQHPATREAMLIFKPHYRLYAGAFVDVVYDHFVALDTQNFATEDQLLSFSLTTYQQLKAFELLMPPAFASMFPYMQTQNWLYHYRFKGGIEKSMGGLVKRAAYLSDSTTGYQLFLQHYDALREHYQQFFPDIRAFAIHQTGLLPNC